MPNSRAAFVVPILMALSACAGDDSAKVAGAPGAPGGGGSAQPEAPIRVRGVPDATPEQQAEYDAFSRLGYTLTWRSFPLVGRGRRALFLDAFDGALTFQDTGNIVTLIEADTGAARWSTEVDEASARFVGNVLRGDRLYSASDNELFILDARTGNILERHDLAVVVNTRPVLAGAIAVFGASTGELLGHNLASGYKQWGYAMRGAITARPALVPGFAGEDDAVGVVSQGGDVLMVNARTGASFGHASVFAGLENTPVASADTLFVASTDQSVYAFDLGSGRQRWRLRTERPITDQPALAGDSVYVAAPGRGLLRIDAATGGVRWAAPGVSGEVIALRGGRLIVWDANTETALSLDADRGDVVERATLVGVVRLIAEKFEDGALYAMNRAGRVSKFGPR